MNAAVLLEQVRQCGARIGINGDRLRIAAPAPLPDKLLLELRAHKLELLALLAANESPDPRSIADWYQERATIMEFDGGLSRDDADQQAWARTLLRFGLPDDYRLH